MFPRCEDIGLLIQAARGNATLEAPLPALHRPAAPLPSANALRLLAQQQHAAPGLQCHLPVALARSRHRPSSVGLSLHNNARAFAKRLVRITTS